MGSICMIYVKEKDLVVPGEILAEDDYYAGRGTFQENGKVCSNLLGLVSLRNKKISVIPLKSKYLPKKGDVVIGKIDDVRFSMWGVDINSPYPGILPASEVFGRDKKDLSRVFDIGDVLFLRIVDVDEVKKVKLGLKGRGMGKFKGGIIVDIAPTKVPRLIGKKGSMINMIKDKTGCKIVVGQNGLVWVKGKQEMEQIVKDTIKLIEKEAHTSGLTDRIKNRLCLLIDGELPEEENEEIEENFDDAFKKPELQDFREEAERELADEKAQNEEDFDDLDEDIDESEDDFDEDIDESEDDFEDVDESEDDFEDVDESEDDFDEDIDESEDDFEDESEEDDEEDIDESEEEIESLKMKMNLMMKSLRKMRLSLKRKSLKMKMNLMRRSLKKMKLNLKKRLLKRMRLSLKMTLLMRNQKKLLMKSQKNPSLPIWKKGRKNLRNLNF